MSQNGSQGMPSRKPQANRVSGSTYSVNTTLRKTRAGLKEEMIAKKITEIFKEKEQKMIRTIEQTIVEHKLLIYKQKRAEFDEEMNELEAERKRIIKKKKNKKDRAKALKANTRQQLYIIAKALNQTVLHYKSLYFENDYYRFKKLLDVQQSAPGEPPMDEKEKHKKVLEQLHTFFASPFKDDRRFTIYHLAQVTRDRLEQSNKLVNALFFNKIFDMLLKTTDERNKLKAFEILCNLIQSATHRKKLAKDGYFKMVYDAMQVGKVDDKTLDKLSWMTTLICFHPDMIEQIVSLKLLNFIIKLVDNKFPASVRSNAVLAISLLTYHESLFNELINNGVIDIVMNLCMDQQGEMQVKQFSTLALVHFALSKQSINILIEKGIMDLFNSLGVIGDAQIQTNVSWIFLALCNNGITGKQMLINGITRDMFLVSCNPQFSQIRHLVIAGFAELGRCTDWAEQQENLNSGSLQRIKEKAIVGMHDAFRLHADETINILLRFSISNELKFMITAFWALKDYILLNHDRLISDLSGVICAFVNGAAEESDPVKTECANAISFLITHQLVFNKADQEKKMSTREPGSDVWTFNPHQNYVLDALMLLSGSESLQVRTRAFSTLSTLSTYASQSEDLMPQIQADIMMPNGMISRQYYQFITERIAKSRESFVKRYKQADIETKYAGLYCLLRLAQCPDEKIAIETAIYLHQFYYPEHYNSIKIEEMLQEVTVSADQEMSQSQKERLSINLVRDDCDERQISLDALNEKFFMFVFQALLYSKNRCILYLLLDVINFYIKHATEYQERVINASTILWMLQILDYQRRDRALCLLVAKTVLKIVDNHQILFDYQEMAIIKKFNKALENLNKDPNLPDEPTSSEDEKIEEESSQRQPRKSQLDQASYQSLVQDVRAQLDQQLKGRISPLPDDYERFSERARRSQPIEIQNDQKAVITHQSADDLEQLNNGVSNDVINTGLEQEFSSKIIRGTIDVSLPATSPLLPISPAPESLTGSLQHSSHNTDKPSDKHKSASRQVHDKQSDVYSIKQQVEQTQGTLEQSLKIMGKNSIINSDSSKSSLKPLPTNLSLKQSQQSKKPSEKREKPQIKPTHQFIPSPQVLSEFAEQNNELRDALIKSFMVIFTNEKSQHLLLNQDIIDIAFSCLEYCDSISVDAKRNLARLISIIFKFPQVQERILQEKIIIGIVHLLSQDLSQQQIISHALRSCTYISLSYNFVNSPLSLKVLKALTPLMDRLDSTTTQQQRLLIQSQKVTSPAEVMSDKDNCLFAIANLLKGSTANAQHFIQSDAPRKVMQELLRVFDELTHLRHMPEDKLEIVELCVAAIKQLANSKQTFKEFLSFSNVNRELLTECLNKAFQISDCWSQYTTELLRFRKILEVDVSTPIVKNQRLDSKVILDLNHENIESFKASEILESKEDKSIKMAPIVKIRNNIYYIVVGCFKAGFSIEFILKNCQLLRRLVGDLQLDDLNDYIFQHLIMCLQSLMKDNEALEDLFRTYNKQLHVLFTGVAQMDKRIVYIKSVIQAVLRVPEQICDHNPEFFGQLFAMAVDIPQTGKHTAELEDITENVLWLQTTLLDVNLSESQQQKAIKLCVQFKTAPVLVKCIKSKNERILLQALKGLCTVSTLSDFRQILLLELGDTLFVSLAEIINKRLQHFNKYKLEIETQIVCLLAQITLGNGANENLTTVARKRVVQQGFVDNFVSRCIELDYMMQGADMDELEELDEQFAVAGSSQELNAAMMDDGDFDDIDRVTDCNLLMENTAQLIANATELRENHYPLIAQQNPMMRLIVSLAQQMLTQVARSGEELPVNLLSYQFGNLNMGKYIASIFHNLARVHQEGTTDVQEVCVQCGFGQLFVQLVQNITDYEMHIKLYEGMSELVLSTNAKVASMAIEQGCYKELNKGAYESDFHKVRRICVQALEKVPQNLVDNHSKPSIKRMI